MATFHVYVEGPVAATPDATRLLADAMAARYGLPAAELISRLAKGRFRVKANVDRETAETYRRDLAAIGARVVIEDTALATPRTTRDAITPPAGTRTTRDAITPPAGTRTTRDPITPPAGTRTTRDAITPPASRTTTSTAGGPPPSAPKNGGAVQSTPPAPARTTTSSLPPAVARTASASAIAPPAVARTASALSFAPPSVARTTSSVLPPPDAARAGAANPAQFASGLSAAFSGSMDEMASSSLGALEYGDTALSLASLDGVDSEAAAGSFEPPADVVPAPPAAAPPSRRAAPAPARPAAKPAAKSAATEAPLDLFAPPDAESPATSVDFAIDDARHGTPPPPAAPASLVASVTRPSAPAIAASPIHPPAPLPSSSPPRAAPTSRLGPLADPRARFAAGVGLAIVLGFVPAHLVAAMRERSSDHAIDAKLAVVAASAVPDQIDQAWRTAAGDKRSARRNIALTAMLIWAAAGGALGYAWFRGIPWDRYDA